MADVELLDALVGQIAKSRQGRSAGLEARKRFRQVVLREVVVAGEMLIFRQFVIYLKGGLVGSLVPHGHILKGAVRTIGLRHI